MRPNPGEDYSGPVYTVLQSEQLRKEDRERASAILTHVHTADEAKQLSGKDQFGYRVLDMHGRVGAILYRGVEVAVLFKRQLTQRAPAPGDPVPEGVVRDPDGAWLRIDLLGLSRMVMRRGAEDRVILLQKNLEREQVRRADAEERAVNAESKWQKFQAKFVKLEGLEVELQKLKEEGKYWKGECENAQRDVGKVKTEAVDEQMKMLSGVLEVYNTLWMAEQHQAATQLTEILRKQFLKMLLEFGALPIEPKQGDEFDPEVHHAVHGYPFPAGSVEINKVVGLHHVGMRLGKRIIRAADVLVGVEQQDQEQTVQSTM